MTLGELLSGNQRGSPPTLQWWNLKGDSQIFDEHRLVPVHAGP